jgi:hypothetical protein
MAAQVTMLHLMRSLQEVVLRAPSVWPIKQAAVLGTSTTAAQMRALAPPMPKIASAATRTLTAFCTFLKALT